ncbi:Stk1 family PASTA domain-containing Ser/Thr kinase [Paenibacillus sp. J5C_2022]|uniref:Stk1 family PASTA domain-containing Ser/Thr kinase n=1 Tax=Paenibacillus sp. J5C2022 TaxID=2977129 RepID=UPI0021D35A01|nr:Stk1 family PASTA domain-containing Ser/Thr kinase [Paenibacillus sp. J5C2022]MCU6708949.1 Stk1 family PASTA domain-containing Ser/Thr kinase [Paenibacillus sp. J5C2022]
MIGHNLGGRYEILSRIGGGGMALVYKAHDVLLNRHVAVKVLRQQFVNDDEFIRRFNREAQSAASLSHPNVVSIYDVGQEDDTHYIVMEYVEGHNLNEIIAERAPLQADEAVRIAQQICDALDHAHHNHIIHRDIKPHNILIGNNGRVKVTDFGIARAVTASTITHTGSVVGSVHYFSPEHAKGINAGEKSDLYSLGIVLYQMLTGKLPFLGESPISVALKHLQETFDEPRAVNPHIPQSVENVILKAMRKNPSERYESAKQMQQDLENCLAPGRLNEPKIAFQSSGDLDETKIMPAIRGDAVMPKGTTAHASDTTSKHATISHTGTHWEDTGVASKKRGWKKPVAVVSTTLLLLALMVWGFFILLDKLNPEEVEVPNVVDKSLTEARKEIEAAGLKVKEPVTREFRKDIPLDQVFDQTKKNMKVKEGSFIELFVSDGPEMKEMGPYVGKDKQDVLDELIAMGIDEKRIRIEEVNNEDEEAGIILEQVPAAGTRIDPETASVSFVVSLGPEPTTIPDIIDVELKVARQLLKSHFLVLNEEDIQYVPSYVIKKGNVIEIVGNEVNDEVSKESKVKISVSTGPPEDAITHQARFTIYPANFNKTSEVRIEYSDASGENLDGGTYNITDGITIPVTVILAPDTTARIMIYRDKELMEVLSISYEDAKSGGNSDVSIPGEETPPPSQEPTEAPVQAEVADDEAGDGSQPDNEGVGEANEQEQQP